MYLIIKKRIYTLQLSFILLLVCALSQGATIQGFNVQKERKKLKSSNLKLKSNVKKVSILLLMLTTLVVLYKRYGNRDQVNDNRKNSLVPREPSQTSTLNGASTSLNEKNTQPSTSKETLLEDVLSFIKKNKDTLVAFWNLTGTYDGEYTYGLIEPTFQTVSACYQYRSTIVDIVKQSSSKSSAYDQLKKADMNISDMNILEHDLYETLQSIPKEAGIEYLSGIYFLFKESYQKAKQNKLRYFFFAQFMANACLAARYDELVSKAHLLDINDLIHQVSIDSYNQYHHYYGLRGVISTGLMSEFDLLFARKFLTDRYLGPLKGKIPEKVYDGALLRYNIIYQAIIGDMKNVYTTFLQKEFPVYVAENMKRVTSYLTKKPNFLQKEIDTTVQKAIEDKIG